MIKFTCVGCGASTKVPESLAGQKTRCTKCRNIGVIDSPAAPSQPPPIPQETVIPTRRKTGRWAKAAGVLLLGWFAYAMINSRQENQKPKRPQPSAAQRAKQNERFGILFDLEKNGVIGFRKVVTRGSHTFGLLRVTFKFYVLKFEEKQTIARIAYDYCWCEAPDVEWLQLESDTTAKEVGQFSPQSGFEWY